MTKEKIQDLARKHANQFAITHPEEDWHSHYYGFIYGFQKAQELATNDGSAIVSNPKGTVCLEHDWKGDSFDHFGFCLEEVCENCGEKRQTGC